MNIQGIDEFQYELAAQVEAQVMSCIGCNDCMLACPLEEVGKITIAELNTAIHQPIITNPRVINFVTACTQCRQCVPVCPADLSRADMVLFNKRKVEDMTSDRPLNMQIGEKVRPSRWTLDSLATQLKQFSLFENVEHNELRRLALKSTLRYLSRDEVLCREGEFHERLFVVLSGEVEQRNTGLNKKKIQILVLGPGSFHGEMAVMANQAERFTVAALRRSEVLEIPKATLYQAMKQSDKLRDNMNALYERRAFWSHAKKSPFLDSFSVDALKVLLKGAALQSLKAGELLFDEDDPPKDLYLVRSGFLRASKKLNGRERVLLYFREGDLFNSLPVFSKESVTGLTVRANTPVEVIRISGQVLWQVLALHPASKEKIKKVLQEEKELERAAVKHASSPVKKENTTQLRLSFTALLDKGIMQGSEVLVIDQQLCVNCNNCEDACRRRHGYSRLERTGLQLDNFLFPTACRHCEDPLCLLCSVNGIVRKPDGEISIIEENCIGCGSCASRCPYDNIKMHPREKPKPKNFLGELFDLFRGKKPRADQDEERGPRIAVKCDLCADYEEYACVNACPVNASFRIDPVEVFGRTVLLGLEKKK